MKDTTGIRQPMLRLHDEIIVDNFAGGGGASLGIEMALGRSPDIAVNHDPEAIAMHAANHPETQHFCESVFKVDPVAVCAGRKVGLAWFSPDCAHHSKAKGGKPVKKKIRGLAWVVVSWAAKVKPRVIVLENVEEFQDWGPLGPDGKPCKLRRGFTFRAWWNRMTSLGYQGEMRELRGSDYGAPTTRNRLFIVFRCDGEPIAWPEPTHGPAREQPHRTAAECIDWSLPCPSIFLTKRQGTKLGVKRPLAVNTRKRIARGIWKYVIRAAKPFIVPVTHPQDQRVHDIDEPLRTITNAHRGELALVAPLLAKVKTYSGGGNDAVPADQPLRTVTASKRGEFAVLAPMLTPYYGERRHDEARGARADEPLPTQTTANRFGLVVATITKFQENGPGTAADEPLDTVMAGATRFGIAAATLVQTGYGERPGQAPRSLDIEKPIGTIVGCGGRHALSMAFLAKNFGGRDETGGRSPGQAVTEPTSTVTARDHHSLVATTLVKLRGTEPSHLEQSGAPMDAPLGTISAQGMHFAEVRAFLVKYYSSDGSDGQAQDLREPLHTVTAKPRFGLVAVDGSDYQIADIGLRMLAPRELFRAQGFPDSYVIDPVVLPRKKRIRGKGKRWRWVQRPARRLTKEAQIRCVGNSVCPPLAAAIVRVIMAARDDRREVAA